MVVDKLLLWAYPLIGCVGGAGLGFLSFGPMGLAIGLAGAVLLSLVLYKSAKSLR
jgi:hypothetical protein